MPHDDFQIEPIRGLPELLPEGEEILWQGNPSWWALAKEAYGVLWVAAAVVALVVWRAGLGASGIAPEANFALAIAIAALGGGGVAVLALTAWLQARESVYTLTSQRAVMRFGLLQTATLQIPFAKLSGADLAVGSCGTGTIALRARSADHLSYILTWPHVRPWKVKPIDPAFRCIKDAQQVAALLADAAQAEPMMPIIEKAQGLTPVAAE